MTGKLPDRFRLVYTLVETPHVSRVVAQELSSKSRLIQFLKT